MTQTTLFFPSKGFQPHGILGKEHLQGTERQEVGQAGAHLMEDPGMLLQPGQPQTDSLKIGIFPCHSHSWLNLFLGRRD